jgi:hypothetical protein
MDAHSPSDKLRIWRNFKIGKLLDLTVLDTRELTGLLAQNAWVAGLMYALGVYDRDLTDVYYITGEFACQKDE